MAVRRNNPNLPSCETVVQQGVGMRIKGIVDGRLANTRCKVRNIADPAGNVVKYNKQNEHKVKQKTEDISHSVQVSLFNGNANKHVNLIYDTGAEITTMSTQQAKELGIIERDGSSRFVSNLRQAGGVGGRVRGRSYDDVPLVLDATGEVAIGEIMVYPNAHALLGTEHISKYKRYRVKFKP